MKYFFCLFYFLPIASHAITFEVVGRSGQKLLAIQQEVKLSQNVGQLSVLIFDKTKTPYHGGDFGFTSIFHLKQENKIISQTEMKAYGWCFSIDGVVPETMPDKTIVEKPNSHIAWFYAYAHYKNGEWISQCTKSD